MGEGRQVKKGCNQEKTLERWRFEKKTMA